MTKKNINRITIICSISYILVLIATKYNAIAFSIGTILLIILIILNIKFSKEQ